MQNQHALLRKLAAVFEPGSPTPWNSPFQTNLQIPILMTDYRDIMQMKLEHTLVKYPQLIAHWTEMEEALKSIRHTLWFDLLRRLKSQLCLRNIEMSDRVGGGIACQINQRNLAASIIDGKQLRCLVIFHANTLKVGVCIHAKSEKASEAIRIRHETTFIKLRRRLRAQFQDRLIEDPRQASSFPLDFVQLKENFLTNEFVAKYAQNNQRLDNIAKRVAKSIDEYLAVLC